MGDALLQSAENRVISELRRKTEQLIKDIGRPQQLYNIDKSKTALIVVDMQNFVCDPADEHKIQGIHTSIKNINRLVDACHEEHIPVIWVRHNITVDESGNDAGLYSRFHKTPLPKEVTNLSHGTLIYKELHFKEAEDYQVCKNRYSAFFPGTSGLDNILKALGRTQLIFTGVVANVCVESTVRDAMQLGYEVILVSDAIAAMDRVVLEVTLMNTRLLFGDVRDSATVLEDLDNRRIG